jgi:type I restriction enzyme, S subunit
VNWPTATLGELSTSPGQYGTGLSSRDWQTGDPRYIRITDINDGGRLNPNKVAPSGDPTEWRKAVLRDGDLLFARSGATVGKTYLHTESHEEAVYAGYLIRFRLDLKRVVPRFVFWFTHSDTYRSWVDATKQAVAQPNINAKQYATLPIPVPPLDEQVRIAAIFDEADALRHDRDTIIRCFDAVPQATYLSMFGDPATNPHDWPIRPLTEWIDPARPITYGILKPGPDTDGGVPYVRVADMKDRGIELSGIRRTTTAIADQYRRSSLSSGDLLVSIRGHVGRFACVPDELSGANITQDSARLAIKDQSSAVYVRTALETASLQNWMRRRTKGAAVQGINLGDLRLAPVPCPPMEQQELFASSLGAMSAAREAARRQLQHLDELFASLQSRAFRGEL